MKTINVDNVKLTPIDRLWVAAKTAGVVIRCLLSRRSFYEAAKVEMDRLDASAEYERRRCEDLLRGTNIHLE